MDKNKLQKLKDINFSIRKCCGNCTSGKFLSGNDWGTCTWHVYKHEKHTGGQKGSVRELSTNKYGHCLSHVWNGTFIDSLNSFKEFAK